MFAQFHRDLVKFLFSSLCMCVFYFRLSLPFPLFVPSTASDEILFLAFSENTDLKKCEYRDLLQGAMLGSTLIISLHSMAFIF